MQRVVLDPGPVRSVRRVGIETHVDRHDAAVGARLKAAEQDGPYGHQILNPSAFDDEPALGSDALKARARTHSRGAGDRL